MDSGIWTFRLTPEDLVTGEYDLWLPSRGILNPATRFLQPVPETTLTIPSTAARVITVGAYDDSYRAYADFSGRGYTRQTRRVKPDLAAPGVDIVAAKSGGGYEAGPVSGGMGDPGRPGSRQSGGRIPDGIYEPLICCTVKIPYILQKNTAHSQKEC